MADHIWIVRAPDGRVIGASVRSEASAILDTLGHCGSTTRTHMGRLQRHVELQGVPQNSYEKDGYTLTREPLTPAPVVPVVTEADENGDVWMSVSVGPVTVDEAIACLRRHGWAIDTAAITAAPDRHQGGEGT